MTQPLNEAMEQLETASIQIAKIVASYYTELRIQGISDEMATKLTQEFQARMLDVFWKKPDA